MAKGDIQVQIKGDYNDKDINRAIRDLNALKTQAGATAGPMAGLGKTALAAGAGFASFAMLGRAVDFLKSAASAAAEEDQAMRTLAKSLENVGQGHRASGAEEFVAGLQKSAAVSDGELRPALQTLISTTGDLTKAQSLLETALDASAGTGKDLNTVTLAIAKASNGQIGALTRLGIPLDQNIIKSKDFAAALDVMNAKFGGQAATAAKSYAGQLKGIQIAADDATEVVGFALLGAIEDASKAFGGTGGLSDAITEAGETLADFITGTGAAATGIAQLAAAAGDFANVGGEGEESWGDFAKSVATGLPVLGHAYLALDALIQVGGSLRDNSEDRARVLAAESSRWGEYALALSPVARKLAGITEEADGTAEATKELATANDLLKSSIDRITSKDDLTSALRNLGKAAREAKGDITGNKDASIDLRAELGMAATAALGFAQTTGISAQDTYNIFTRKIQAMKDNLIANKVSAKDAEAWVNKVTWLAQFQLLADAIGKGPAAEAMRLAGIASGRKAWQGIVQGLREGQDNVATAAGNVAAAANRGAQAALDAHSPSRVWRGLGLDATKGFELGLEDGTPEAVDAARDLFNATLDAARSARDQARGAMSAVSDSIVGQVLGNVGFSTTDAEGNALTPQQIMASILGSAANQQAAVSAIAANVGTALPPALLQQMLSMKPDAAIALANYLGGAEGSAMLAQLTTNYATLSASTQTFLGKPMGAAWGLVGTKSAREMLAEARATLAELAPGFARWASNNLGVTIPVNFDVRGANIPGRASGGPVSGGSPYIVGERGPELFVPSQSGSIVPNHRMGTGASVNVTVNAGMGADGYQIGAAVVDAIKKYERVAGPVFAAA